MHRRAIWAVLLGTSTAIGLACSSFETTNTPVDQPDATEASTSNDAASDAVGTEAGEAKKIVDVAAGDGVACALRNDGKVFCWGSNNEGAIGELENSVDDKCGANVPCRFSPREVPGIDGAAQIALSGNTVFARRFDGTVWVWGANGSGLLGNGTINPSSRARPQPVPGVTNAVDIVAGWSIACARLGNGDAACWGQGLYAMLQEPASFNIKGPEIKSALAGSKKISLSMTGGLGCAIGADDAVRCWGQNLRGSLGYGPDGGVAGDVSCGISGERCQVQPIAIGNLKASAIASGQYASCAIPLGGGLVCWGSNISGELGQNSFDNAPHPIPTSVTLPGTVSAIAGSTRHFCALADGLHCWGRNEVGEIGNGLLGEACVDGDKCTKTPAKVTAVVARVSAGLGLTVALSPNGSVSAWGANKDARLGHRPGDNGDSPTCGTFGNQLCNGTPQEIKLTSP